MTFRWTPPHTKADKFNRYIADLDGVQAVIEETAFEIAVRAEQILLNHRQEGHARIDISEGDIDWHVALDDSRGQQAAAAIEYGRVGFIDQDGNVTGASEGLYVLHQAARIRKRPRNKVPIERVKTRRRNRKRKGR